MLENVDGLKPRDKIALKSKLDIRLVSHYKGQPMYGRFASFHHIAWAFWSDLSALLKASGTAETEIPQCPAKWKAAQNQKVPESGQSKASKSKLANATPAHSVGQGSKSLQPYKQAELEEYLKSKSCVLESKCINKQSKIEFVVKAIDAKVGVTLQVCSGKTTLVVTPSELVTG